MKITNTTYVIKDLIDLKGKTLTIPSGCTLEFSGGMFTNGTLVGKSTSISAPIRHIFSPTLNITGDWLVDRAYPEWFGAIPNDSKKDSRDGLQRCAATFSHIILTGTYYLNSATNQVGIELPVGCVLEGISVPHPQKWKSALVANSRSIKKILKLNNSTEISNLYIKGNSDGVNRDNGIIGLFSDGTSRIKMSNVQISHCYEALNMTTYLTELDRVTAFYCVKGLYFHGSATSQYTSVSLNNCYVFSTIDYGFYFDKMIYSSLITCAADYIGYNSSNALCVTGESKSAYVFDNSQGINMSACGIENCYSWVQTFNTNRLNIQSCRFMNQKRDNKKHLITLKNCVDCNFDVSYEVLKKTNSNPIVLYSHYTNKFSNTVRGFNDSEIEYISTGPEILDKIKRTLNLQ